jgi:hypothetical protein
MNEISVFVQETPESSLIPFIRKEHRKKMAFFFFLNLVVLGIEPKALYLVGKLCYQPFCLYLVFEIGFY